MTYIIKNEEEQLSESRKKLRDTRSEFDKLLPNVQHIVETINWKTKYFIIDENNTTVYINEFERLFNEDTKKGKHIIYKKIGSSFTITKPNTI